MPLEYLTKEEKATIKAVTKGLPKQRRLTSRSSDRRTHDKLSSKRSAVDSITLYGRQWDVGAQTTIMLPHKAHRFPPRLTGTLERSPSEATFHDYVKVRRRKPKRIHGFQQATQVDEVDEVDEADSGGINRKIAAERTKRPPLRPLLSDHLNMSAPQLPAIPHLEEFPLMQMIDPGFGVCDIKTKPTLPLPEIPPMEYSDWPMIEAFGTSNPSKWRHLEDSEDDAMRMQAPVLHLPESSYIEIDPSSDGILDRGPKRTLKESGKAKRKPLPQVPCSATRNNPIDAHSACLLGRLHLSSYAPPPISGLQLNIPYVHPLTSRFSASSVSQCVEEAPCLDDRVGSSTTLSSSDGFLQCRGNVQSKGKQALNKELLQVSLSSLQAENGRKSSTRDRLTNAAEMRLAEADLDTSQDRRCGYSKKEIRRWLQEQQNVPLNDER